MLTSENIDEKQIELVKRAFRCDVLPQYGMTETCAFGFTNFNELKYYCSPYYGITEVLNKNGNQIVRTQQDGGTNQIGGQIVIPLAAGDYVTIVSQANGTSTAYLGGGGITYNQFSGFLVG